MTLEFDKKPKPQTNVLEKEIEAAVRKEVKAMGGYLLKWTSAGETGVPDRICLLPSGRIIFMEFKTDKGVLSKRQILWGERLQALGFDYRVIRRTHGIFSTEKLPDRHDR